MKKKKSILLLTVFSCFLLTSCKDYLNLVPKNETIVATVEDVKTELLAYWVGATYYSFPLPSYGNSAALSLPIYGDVNIQLAMYEDNMNMMTFRDHPDINEKCMTYYYQDIDWKGISLATTLWQTCYNSIGFMNAIISDLDGVDATQAEYERISGEARLIRAWNIFKLIQFFAPYADDKLGIPLNLDSENVTPGNRLTQTEVYDVIEKELLDVATYTTPREEWNFFYTPDFIHSFLADMYMFRAGSAAAKESDWSMAETYSAKVIQNYIPEDRAELLTDLFSGESLEMTPEHAYCALKLATKRTHDIGGSYTGIWGINNAQQASQDLWAMYDPADIRRVAWFSEINDDEGMAVYIAKPIKYIYGPVGDIFVLYRKAELYLINAEAKCRQSKDSEAAQMLEKFRSARIPGYDTPISGDVLSEVLKERRLELCFENGSRWLDMKRLGLSLTRTGFDKESNGTKTYTLKSDDYRYTLPIPKDIELDYNNINQNPGWTTFN